MQIITRFLNRFGFVPVVQQRGEDTKHPDIVQAVELSLSHLQNAKILPNRDHILPLMPKNGVVAEVGVALGEFSRKIIDVMQPRHFIAVDLFELHKLDIIWGQKTQSIFKGATHEEYYRQRFQSEIQKGTVGVKKGLSYAMMQEFPDRHFDMIYVDAAHDYQSVRKDIEVCNKKVKHDGFMVMNDYTMFDPLIMQPYGVVQATNEFCIREGWEVIYLALQPCMFCDLVLRKM